MSSCHDGHRQRVRDKFAKYGGDIFEDHEILEQVLFFTIPRGDTNEIAHALIDRFGSLRGVLDAGIHEISGVKGMGDKSAYFLKVISSLFARISIENVDKRERFTSYRQVAKYLGDIYIGTSVEEVYLLAFNNSMRLLGTEKIAEGNLNTVSLHMSDVVNCANKYNPAYVMLSHNHPGGLAIPSSNDIEFTTNIRHLFSMINIKLIEHFIVADGKCVPIIHGGAGDPRRACDETINRIALNAPEITIDETSDMTFEI